MSKPNIHILPWPMEFNASVRRQALAATCHAYGENNMHSVKFRQLYTYNVDRLKASLGEAVK